MTQKKKAGFGNGKGLSGEHINPRLREALQSRANESGLACATAFAVAAEMEVQPKAVGEAMDQLRIPIIKCQLGLFGYAPEKKIVAPAKTVSADEEQGVRQALVNGRLPCAICWQLATTFGKTRLEMASICEGLAVKISPCQLGAF
jgi:hypothetical protein